ncbi:MAG: hypothetical protein QM784_07650 [Polyangiaceae bacterium]
MKLSHRIWTLPLFAGLVVAAAVACSEGSGSSDDNNGGNGGASNEGGASDGGSTGSSTEKGGSTSTSGGSTAAGGTTAAATTKVVTQAWEFAEDDEGFKPIFGKAAKLTDPNEDDLAAGTALKDGTTVDWVNKPGFGQDVGYISIIIPMAGEQSSFQAVDVGIEKFAVPLDLSGKTISCRVKVVKGLKMTGGNYGGGKLVVKSGENWVYASGDYTTLTPGSWTEMTITVGTPKDQNEGYDPTQIIQFAVSVNTPSDQGAVDTPAEVLVDHCWY